MVRTARLPTVHVSVEYWVQQTLVELHWMCCTGFE